MYYGHFLDVDVGEIFADAGAKAVLWPEHIGAPILRSYMERMAETETLNNFCPSRFSQECPDFQFSQNTNLYRISRHTF